MMARVRPTAAQYRRLLEANAHRCCVCKRRGVGFHLHHIDGKSANTVDANLAVVCVEDHDRHHRPGEYAPVPNHTELSATELLGFKSNWESFVAEAGRPEPKVLATLSTYGTKESIHAFQLVMQWPNEQIVMKQSYHLLDRNLDRLTDEVIADVASIGAHLKIAMISEPLPIEHCPCCGTGYSRTLKRAVVARLTDPGWAIESSATIYINPDQPSLAILISLRQEKMVSGGLHLCQGQCLHYHDDGIDDRVPLERRLSVRTQASRIVETVLNEWKPALIFIGTGDPDNPKAIDDLILPKCWEETKKSEHRAYEGKKRR